MKKVFVLICYNLGIWGILGFFATLILGFLACCANLSPNVFYGALIVFAIIGLSASSFFVIRELKRAQ